MGIHLPKGRTDNSQTVVMSAGVLCHCSRFDHPQQTICLAAAECTRSNHDACRYATNGILSKRMGCSSIFFTCCRKRGVAERSSEDFHPLPLFRQTRSFPHVCEDLTPVPYVPEHRIHQV